MLAFVSDKQATSLGIKAAKCSCLGNFNLCARICGTDFSGYLTCKIFVFAMVNANLAPDVSVGFHIGNKAFNCFDGAANLFDNLKCSLCAGTANYTNANKPCQLCNNGIDAPIIGKIM